MNLDLTAEERDELMRLVDNSLSETRVEVRRTRTPDFRDQLQREEELLRRLHDKLERMTGQASHLA